LAFRCLTCEVGGPTCWGIISQRNLHVRHDSRQGKSAFVTVSLASVESLDDAMLFSYQVDWPEQSAARQHPGSWDPLAVQGTAAQDLAQTSQKAAAAPFHDRVCILLGVGGAVALIVAMGAAWLYMG